jgi:ABC-type microcin C transport system permease subunit YejE
MNFVICALLLLSCLKSNFERLRQAPQEQQWKTKLGTSEAGRHVIVKVLFLHKKNISAF